MDKIALEVAFRVMEVIARSRETRAGCGTLEFQKEKIRTAAHAITQLWGDVLEEEGRRKVGQKALA
ncbi:hypothetical protein [Acetobacter fabarum]|uniref:hypothetical protein n=1 Tax=Acetobacter fabarum TaxID=483199 RepID=UPI0039E8F6AE